MATTITKSIGSAGGRDYATVADWVTAMPASLVTADEVWVGELYNDSEFTPASIYIGGKTTDSTRYIHLRCAAGHSFKDHASKATNPLRYDQSKGVGFNLSSNGASAFTVDSAFTIVEGLQIRHTSNPATRGTIDYKINSGTFKNCIVENTATSGWSSNSCMLYAQLGGTYINNVFILRTVTVGTGVHMHGQANGATNGDGAYYNNTFIALAGSSSNCFHSNNVATPTSRIIKNNAAFGFGAFANLNTHYNAASGYNATDLSTALSGTSGDVLSLTTSSQFENVTTGGSHDIRAKAGNGLGAGTRDQTNTGDLDIAGRSRSTTTPTIGAWEYAVAAGGRGRNLILGVG